MDLPLQIHAASQSWDSDRGLLEIPARKASNNCRRSEAAKANRRLSFSATCVLTSSYRALRVNCWKLTHRVLVVDVTDLRLEMRWQLSPVSEHSLFSFSLRKIPSPPFTLKSLPIPRSPRSSSSSVCSSRKFPPRNILHLRSLPREILHLLYLVQTPINGSSVLDGRTPLEYLQLGTPSGQSGSPLASMERGFRAQAYLIS